MRLFVAVNFDDETKGRLCAVQNRIKKQAVRGNFSRPENFHLTLVFLGETAADLVPELAGIIKNAVSAVNTTHTALSAHNPCTINFSRTGCFRHSGKELWWIGPAPDNGPGLTILAELRRRIAAGFGEAGIPYDRRPFRVHITLGREIKPSVPIVPPEEMIIVPLRRISLMNSEHTGNVLTYTEVAGWDVTL